MNSPALVQPDFVIIGAMKSATSSLQEQLDLLPGIFTTEPKEPNFFSNDEIFANGVEWYSGLYAPAKQGDIKGEASTHYAKLPRYPETVQRLKSYAPNAKLIYVMRHPIDRLISHYIHNWSMGFVPRKKKIEQALEDYENFVSYSLYAMQLAPWFEAYGRGAVLPVFFDRLLACPQQELERICEHIGYTDPVVWREDVNPSNVSSQRLRKFPLYDLLIDSKPMEWLRQTFVSQNARDAIKRKLQLNKRPELSEEIVADLEKIFDQDLSILGSWLGVELDCRNFRELTSSESLGWQGSARKWPDGS